MKKMNLEELGEMIDEYIKEHDIVMRICFPKGSTEPDILSPMPSPVFEFYMMLYAMHKVFEKLLDMDCIDKRNREKIIDGVLDMIKGELMKEEK